MMRKVEEWVFSDEDKEQIKSYSKDISILYKIRGYDPDDDFDCFFESLEDFDFIPCVREFLDNADDDDDEQDIVECLDSAYDPSVSVNLEWLEEYSKKNATSVRKMAENLVEFYSYDTNDLLDFIFSCGVAVKQNFIDFLTK